VNRDQPHVYLVMGNLEAEHEARCLADVALLLGLPLETIGPWNKKDTE
jgi:hypothetical protein